MSKTIPATCVGGVVTAEDVPIEGAVILSEGIGASNGVVVLDLENATYIPKTSPDLKSAIEDTVSGLEAASSGLSQCSTGFTTLIPFTTDPTTVTIAFTTILAQLALAISGISDAVSSLNALKAELK